jgi:RNA-directed DNA polymerase
MPDSMFLTLYRGRCWRKRNRSLCSGYGTLLGPSGISSDECLFLDLQNIAFTDYGAKTTPAFDTWMARNYPHSPFERYADDAICHCQSAKEARALWSALADRLAVCKLVLHPVKTKIVYCKDANRRGDFPIISFDFLGFQFRARKTIWNGKAAHGFMPAASPKALTAMSRTVRRWSLHHRSDKTLQELAEMYNPCIRGWITYYSHFYKTRLRPTLKRIDAYVIRWARRKFKLMRHQTKGARDWFDRLHRANPRLFAHWPLCHGNGRTSGAV